MHRQAAASNNMASEIPTSENQRQTNYKTHVSPTILQCQQSTTQTYTITESMSKVTKEPPDDNLLELYRVTISFG